MSEFQVISADQHLEKEIHATLVEYLGRSLFTLSLQQVDKRLRKVSRLKSVTLKKHWPSTLVIRVVSKELVALTFKEKQLWSVDSDCQRVDAVRDSSALPLLIVSETSRKVTPLPPIELCSFMAELQKQKKYAALNFFQMDEIFWNADRGVVLHSYKLKLEVELGHLDFLSAWKRADLAYAYLLGQGIAPTRLDSSLSRRVVFETGPKLQFYKNELNLKELVHRKEPQAPSVR